MACAQRPIVFPRCATILGVDVGEDFLDAARLSGDQATLSYHRIALASLRRPVITSLAALIADAFGNDTKGAIALVDSPRTPRDVDCSGPRMIVRSDAPGSRAIDASLRELLRTTFNGAMRPLSMFPTPRASYFAACAMHRACKPHLRAIAEELLGVRGKTFEGKVSGGTFTRFMLAGFAVFPALEQLGVRAFEAYPDLQMRLWSNGVSLAPKRERAEAIRVRRIICERLAAMLGVDNFDPPRTLDEADAAVLALSAAAAARTKSLIELHSAAEGRFAIALDKPQSREVQR